MPVGSFVVDAREFPWFAACNGSAQDASRRKDTERRHASVGRPLMNAQDLLQEISDYCRHTGLAESTFGRRAVNDGKLTTRLRNGGRITTDTLDRIRAFISTNLATAATRPTVIERPRETAQLPAHLPAPLPPAHSLVPAGEGDPQRNFRFFDNRQKYLLFVNTCSEKWVIANRVTLELANIHPRPPA